ncbi:MAG: class F sortase [Streptosporangiales bacterium]
MSLALAVVLLLAGSALLTAAGYQAYSTEPPPTAATLGDPYRGMGSALGTDDGDAPGLDRSQPVRLRIPKIGVRTRLVTLGEDAHGEPQLPPTGDVAGWYRRSPTPGQVGAAVIAGHVDWTDGPAVFYRLGDLRPGNKVLVKRRDGRTAVFTVHATGQYAKNDLPTKLIYGKTGEPQLRLITCGGPFSGEHYRDNVVVFAHLTAVR